MERLMDHKRKVADDYSKTITPIVPCYGIYCNNQLFIKRDDLLPFSFGGNKVRIAEEFLRDMIQHGKDCMIGYGSPKSNLCRVLANMCAQRNIKCHIITSEEAEEGFIETNNNLFVKNFGATIHRCTKNEVAQTVSAVLKQCKDKGYDPYYIYGDEKGNGNEAVPVRAYADAHKEIPNEYDYVFVATGTGMTQAGLIAGKILDQTNEKIVGISVARQSEAETEKVKKYVQAYFASLAETPSVEWDSEILVVDDYLCGGYGRYTPRVTDVIREMMLHNGVAMDTTYTGKAFYGMLEYLKQNKISGKKILFVHTGGQPIFYDSIQKIYRQEFSYHQVVSFIREIDCYLPVPLSQRVSIEEYATKLYHKAYIIGECVDGRIVSAVIGYLDHLTDNVSYITLLGTIPEGRHRGYAQKLLRNYVDECKKRGIAGIHLHTDATNIPAIRLYEKLGFVDDPNDDGARPESRHFVYWLGKENA